MLLTNKDFNHIYNLLYSKEIDSKIKKANIETAFYVFFNPSSQQNNGYSKTKLSPGEFNEIFLKNVVSEDISFDTDLFLESFKQTKKSASEEVLNFLNNKVNIHNSIENVINNNMNLKFDKLRSSYYYVDSVRNGIIDIEKNETKKTLHNISKFAYKYWDVRHEELLLNIMNIMISNKSIFTEEENKLFFCEILEKQPKLIYKRPVSFNFSYNYFKNKDFSNYKDNFIAINQIFNHNKKEIITMELKAYKYMIDTQTIGTKYGLKKHEVLHNYQEMIHYFNGNSKKTGDSSISNVEVKLPIIEFILLSKSGDEAKLILDSLIEFTNTISSSNMKLDKNTSFINFKIFNNLKEEIKSNKLQVKKNKI